MFRPEVVKPFQTQFPPPSLLQRKIVATAMVAQLRVMEEGNRRFQLCFRVFDPEVERIVVVRAFQALFGHFGGGIFGRHRTVEGEQRDLPLRFSVGGFGGKLSEKTWKWQ